MTRSHSEFDLKNIGPTSEQWLRAVGIYSREDLQQLGSVEAFRIIKAHGFNASLNLLYAMEAALLDIHWTTLSPQTKTKLKAAAKSIF